MVNNMYRKNLEFASLLHDIGKFYQRTKLDYSDEYKNFTTDDYGEHGAHAKWSADFISKYWNSNIANLALYHHNPNGSVNEDLGKIIQKADHHSSGERVSSTKNDPDKTPLISIFSDIWINVDNNNKCENRFLHLKEIDLNREWGKSIPTIKENVFIYDGKDRKSLKHHYLELWEKFSNETNSLVETFNFNTVLALLHKYTSTMPSATYGSKPDISLYDHSKTTAALAVCRYLFDNDENEELAYTNNNQNVYLTINGDISGIQNFIFRIYSPQEAQSGMSKRLRGRSLYLTLLTDAIANRIIKDLNLTKANILFCGGGRFTIIAANTKDTKDSLKDIQDEINASFIDKFNAELYLAIATEECSGNDLKEFGQITYKLSKKLNDEKKHKFINNLEDLFDTEEKLDGMAPCSVCGKLYPKKEKEKKQLCSSCLNHEELGKKVSNAKYMIKCFMKDNFSLDDDHKELLFYEDVLNIGYAFITTEKNDNDLIFKDIKKILDKYDSYVDEYEIIKLNDTDFLEFESRFSYDDLQKISFSFSFIGNTVPKYPNRVPLYFEHLAQISKGANKLGVLKMDVDDLGLIFSTGFNHLKGKKDDSEESGASISRISTLSSQLDLFFSGFINKIASEYTVYSKDIYKEVDSEIIKEYFDEIDLELQNKENDHVLIYKIKYEKDLDDDLEEKLRDYEIPTIHINYSGGDDLLVLGPYDEIIKFGEDLRNKFKQWTCNNESINLSGGINIVSPKFPIGKAVNMAESYLEASKSCGKNKITAFGEVVSWDDKGTKFKSFKELFRFGNLLEEYVSQKKLSKNIVYSMLYIWKDNFEEHSGIFYDEELWKSENLLKCSNNQFVPKFAYRLRELNQDSKVYDDLISDGRKNMPWIKIPISWVSLRMR